MDVTMSVVTGGGKKANRVRHSKTLKEVTTWEEAMSDFKKEFRPFFPEYQTLDKPQGKKPKEEKE